MCSFCSKKTDSHRKAKGSQNTNSIQFIRMWFKSIQFCWKKDKHNQYFSLYNFIKLRINILYKLRITEPFDIMFLPYHTFTHLTNNYWAFTIWQRLFQALGWIVNKTKSLCLHGTYILERELRGSYQIGFWKLFLAVWQ